MDRKEKKRKEEKKQEIQQLLNKDHDILLFTGWLAGGLAGSAGGLIYGPLEWLDCGLDSQSAAGKEFIQPRQEMQEPRKNNSKQFKTI